MERLAVESAKHFDSLVKVFKSRHAKALSNCYLLPLTITELAANGQLSYSAGDGQLAFFISFERYELCSLFLDPDATLNLTPGKKTVLTHITGREGIDRASDGLLVDRLLTAGFEAKARSIRMSASTKALEQARLESGLPLEPEGYVVKPAVPAQAEAILKLWHDTTELLPLLIPSEKELLSAIAREEVLCAVREGSVIGALEARLDASAADLIHLAVDSSCRNMRLGYYLMSTYLDEGRRRGLSLFHVWVVDENEAAQRFYARGGYVFDKRISTQYTKAVANS